MNRASSAFRCLLAGLALFFAGCPERSAPGAGDPSAGPPPEALRRPHDGGAPASGAASEPRLKDPPVPTPARPLGEAEGLRPVDPAALATGDAPARPEGDAEGPGTTAEGAAGDAQDGEGSEEPGDGWAFPPGAGAIDLFPGIRFYKDEERLEVRGRICLKRGPTLELLGCTPRGKTHESLLLFDCNPKQLHLALVMLGLQPTPQVAAFGERKALTRGDRVVLEVSWRAEDTPPEDPSAPAPANGRVTRRAEDLVYDQVRKDSMPRVGWVFTGSRNVLVPKPPDWETKHEVYAAEYAGNVAAVYHDPDALLDTPLLEGGDDTVYVAYSDRVPERGTPVVLRLRKWKRGDGPDLPAAPSGGEEGTAPGGSAPGGEEGTAPGGSAPGGEEGTAPGGSAPGGEEGTAPGGSAPGGEEGTAPGGSAPDRGA